MPTGYTDRIPQDINCLWCSSAFTPVHHNNKLCSDDCKRKRRNYTSAKRLKPLLKDPVFLERRHAYDRKSHLKTVYGLTLEDYDHLMLSQDGKCAICASPDPKLITRSPVKYLLVDHDHKTGRIRGLLCDPCNKAIGLMDDCPQTIRRAADYVDAL